MAVLFVVSCNSILVQHYPRYQVRRGMKWCARDSSRLQPPEIIISLRRWLVVACSLLIIYSEFFTFFHFSLWGRQTSSLSCTAVSS